MKPGTGESFVSLADGDLGPTVSVTKLEDGYVVLTISDTSNQRVTRAIVQHDIAQAISAALKRASKDTP